ncbi:MAG TPA: Type 1 glutamine amidotransferase-like domain-containing protein [Candidatus Saccharimonadales bacterium]|nr:Type 1 glutamine amidotransferase-like domain-containing protein [Candidatus Saccharimonadales bacterium]
MKLLLTSSGISKRSVAAALVELVGKSPGETKVGFVPTAANIEGYNKDWLINQFMNLWRYGYNWIDIVDPTAAGVDWKARLQAVDVICVSGGNTFHLLDQCRKIGFDTWLTENLHDKVYVGGSASSIIATPTIEVASLPPGDRNIPGLKDLKGFGWVNFEIEPHCDMNRFEAMEKYAATKTHPVYAIDDQTAIKVIDGKVEVISEGTWKVFNA